MARNRFDLRNKDFLNNPGPMLDQMRAEAAVVPVRLPILGDIWMTTSDAAGRALLKDTENFSRRPENAGKKPMDKLYWWMPGFMAPIMQNMVITDGDHHARLRKLVEKAFARAEIEELRPAITDMANGLLDDLPAGPVDISPLYSRRLPLMVICELLGIPDEDRDRITRWISPISGPTSALRTLAALPSLRKLVAHFRADFDVVRRTGRAGLIRELVAAEADGDRLSEDELLAMVFTLFVAGHETTVHLINDTILALLDHPDQLRALQQDWTGIGLTIEEGMRYGSPVMMTKAHFVIRDMEFHGVNLKRGDTVSALLAGANYDPERFDDPRKFRHMRRPNAHLGFGFGPHICLGMQLARAEAQIAVQTLFTRFPDARLAIARDAIEWSRRIGIHGPVSLPLRLEA